MGDPTTNKTISFPVDHDGIVLLDSNIQDQEILGTSPFVCQGTTDNAFSTTISIGEPTTNKTVSIPIDQNGYVLLDEDIQNQELLGATPLVLQGASDNTWCTQISLTDPTATNTVSIPNAGGIVLLDANIASQELLGTSPFVCQGTSDDTFSTTISVGEPTTNKTVTVPHGFNGTAVLVLEHDETDYAISTSHGETTYCTAINVPTNSCFHSNMALVFKFAGNKTGTAGDAAINLYVGDSNVSTLNISNNAAGDFVGEYVCVQGTNSASQDVYGFFQMAEATSNTPGDVDHVTDTTDFANAQTVKMRIYNSSSNDTVTIYNTIVELK
jgi:hypothetical protein